MGGLSFGFGFELMALVMGVAIGLLGGGGGFCEWFAR